MVFLTGDIHHLASRMGDQKYLPPGSTELAISERYLEIANQCGIEPTLFITGLAAKREPALLKSLVSRYRFEVGGHTYDAVRHRIVLGASRRLLGLANGPYWFQRRDMLRTIRCLSELTGTRVVSWRNHAYRMDKNTYAVAQEAGLLHISNHVSGIDGNARKVSHQLVEIPINTLPDHESLGHDRHRRLCNSVEEWSRRVLEQIEYQQKNNLPSVILAHPLCMYIEDRMNGFKQFCASLTGYRCVSLQQWSAAVVDHSGRAGAELDL